MAIRGATTIAEYAIRKWMEREGFVTECFKLEMTGAHEAVLHDGNTTPAAAVVRSGNQDGFDCRVRGEVK